MQNKVAVIGNSDFTGLYAALGFDIFTVGEDKAQMIERAQAAVIGQYALILVSEAIAAEVESVFGPLQNKALPCVVVVPFTSEPSGYAVSDLGKVLKMATGVDIL